MVLCFIFLNFYTHETKQTSMVDYRSIMCSYLYLFDSDMAKSIAYLCK